MQLLPPQSIDPNVPAQIPADQLQDFKGFLDVVLDTVVGGAAPDVLTLGHQLWGGLAAIVVAWSGLKIAFSGTFEPWSLVRVVLGIAIPRTLLHYYSVPIPGVGFTFPAMVAAGGIWLQNLFISDVVSVGYTEMTALVQAFAARLGAAWSGWEPDDRHDRGRERVLLVPRCADDGRAARAQPRRALLPDLRAGDLGAGGARDRDPARSRVHPLAAVRAARVPVLGLVPHAHGLHALRRRGRRDPPRVHGRRHGLRHDLYRRLDGHRLLRSGRAGALGRRPPTARRLRPDGRHEGRRARRVLSSSQGPGPSDRA